MQNYFFGKDILATKLDSGIVRKVLAHNENLMIVEVHFPKDGTIGALHDHQHEQITYVIEGEFEFTIGNEKKIVKKGDSMYKQPNIIHGCVCLKAGILLDVFTPERKDFL